MSDRFYNEAWVRAVVDAANVRHGTQQVLREICVWRDFSTGTATFTKQNLQDGTGLTRDTVRKAINALREKGVIVALRNAKGGRGNAVTYQIVNIGPAVPKIDRPKSFPPDLFVRLSRMDGHNAAFDAQRVYQKIEAMRAEGTDAYPSDKFLELLEQHGARDAIRLVEQAEAARIGAP